MIKPGVTYKGKVSSFGGPLDSGVKHDEGLALYNKYEECPEIFLWDLPDLLKTDPGYPGDAEGLARRLNPNLHYCACRWDYKITPKRVLIDSIVVIYGVSKNIMARPVDWGPHVDTGRIIDVSPGVMDDLNIKTDDEVEFILLL